jgi:hypothetical protein
VSDISIALRNEVASRAADRCEGRPLSPDERALVRWLLQHGEPDAAAYLPQVDRARVISGCSCGCASVSFSIDGAVPNYEAGMRALSSYAYDSDNGAACGIFVSANGGLLSGLEVCSADGPAEIAKLPAIDRLMTYEEANRRDHDKQLILR